MSAFVYVTAVIVLVSAIIVYMCFIKENLDYVAINTQNLLQSFPSSNITSFPIGAIVLYPTSDIDNIPEGWILCDGTTQYTGNNGKTLTTPKLNGNTQILSLIASKLNHVFILKTGVLNATTLFPLLYDGTNFSVSQSIDSIPNNIITLFNGLTPPTGWNSVSNLGKNFTPFTTSSVTPTPTYQSIQSELSNMIQEFQSDVTNSTNELNQFLTWDTADRANKQKEIDYYNELIGSFQAQQSQLNACMTSAQNDISNINSTTLQNLGQIALISKLDNSSSTYGKLAMDAIGNLTTIPSLPSGVIILWNGFDSEPPATLWNRCSTEGCGNLNLFPFEKNYQISTGGVCAYTVSQLVPDGVFLYSLS